MLSFNGAEVVLCGMKPGPDDTLLLHLREVADLGGELSITDEEGRAGQLQLSDCLGHSIGEESCSLTLSPRAGVHLLLRFPN